MAKKQNDGLSESELNNTMDQIRTMVETMEQIYFKNIMWLKESSPKLYKNIRKIEQKLLKDKSKEKYAVELNSSGALDIINKKDKTFMYNCEPFIYGDDKVKEVKKVKKIAFLGIGLGTHVTSIIKELKPKKVLICEKNIQLYKCSMYVTDYEALSAISKIEFSIDTKCDLSKYDQVIKLDF